MQRRLAVAAVLACALSGAALHGARPLADRAEIRRDTYGVPHILAADVEAAGYAFGYAMAEDHAAEIGRRYLQARGDASRHFGASELDADFALRRLDNRGAARRALRQDTGRDFRRWLEGFAAGVNAYVDANRPSLPAWMPVVEPSDPLAFGRMFGVLAALDPPRELLQKYPPSSVRLQRDTSDEHGSNAFAVAGSRTASGKAMLLGNPHLTWSSLYWEAHVTVPGRLNFYGSTLVGIPVLRAGFNDRVAYVQTNNAPDLEDIYALPLAPGRTDAYVHEGRTRPIQRVAVTVGDEQREFEQTPLGPVIHRAPGRVFVVRSMNVEWMRGYEGFFELQRVRTLRQFRRALGRRFAVTSNYTYADADGNILYTWQARLPRRRDPSADYSVDVPGDTRRWFWRGVHDVDDLPSLLNPASGYVQNANNPPWWTTARETLDPSRYPSYVEPGQLSLRAQLALDELESRTRLTENDVRAVKFTTRVLAAERLVPELLAAAEQVASPSEPLRAGIDTLSAWDLQVAAGSRGAVLFDRFLERHGPFATPWDRAQPFTTPRGLAPAADALRHLEQAVLDVRQEHGSERVAWGDVHRLRIGGLDLPGSGGPGRLGIYRVLNFETAPDGRRVAGRAAPKEPLRGTGDAWVLLVHFTQPVSAWSVLAYGQTGNLRSPHSRDQLQLFADGHLRPVWFSETDIAAHLERRYRPGSRTQ